uniref:Platelet endothelial cell adhesion molecule n=1 Tax=Latimeria chalumnae TaxID=7897 RepID=H3B5Z8_LATCH
FSIMFIHLKRKLLRPKDTGLKIMSADLKINAKTVQKGENFVLTCSVKISIDDHTQPSFQFKIYKEDDLFKSLTSQKKEYTLSIRAQKSHTGNYYCAVNSSYEQQRSKPVTLTVEGSWSKPVLTVNQTTVILGDTIDLLCEAPEEIPPLKFSFYSESLISRLTSHDGTSQTLKHTIDSQSENSFYCKVSGSEEIGLSPLSDSITISIQDLFSNPRLVVSPSNSLAEGNILNITCSVTPSLQRSVDQLEITIQKGDVRVPVNHSHSKYMKFYTKQAHVSDTGEYQCFAEANNVRKSSKQNISVIGKHIFLPPILVVPHKSALAKKQQQKCRKSFVEQLPTSDSACVLQLKSNFKASEKKKNLSLLPFPKLSLSSQPNDKKIIYKMASHNLLVVYPNLSNPELKSIPNNLEVVLGQSVELSCRSSVGSTPIRYTFFREDQFLSVVNITEPKDIAVLKVPINLASHSGKYKCKAENKWSIKEKYSNSLTFSIIVPVQWVSLNVSSRQVQEGENLSLTCSVQSGSVPITFYFYKQNERIKEILVNSTTVDLTVYPLSKNENTYFCEASNKASKIAKSEVVMVTVNLPYWKIIFIGVILLLTLILLVVLCKY